MKLDLTARDGDRIIVETSFQDLKTLMDLINKGMKSFKAQNEDGVKAIILVDNLAVIAEGE